jgi:hypothetical protein
MLRVLALVVACSSPLAASAGCWPFNRVFESWAPQGFAYLVPGIRMESAACGIFAAQSHQRVRVRRRLRPDNWRCILALGPRSHQALPCTRYCVNLLQEAKHAASRPEEPTI